MSVKQKITVLIICGYLLVSRVFGQPAITRVEYFFNTDPGFGLANPIPVVPNVNIPDLSVNIPLAGLSPGLNTLFIRSANANNVWSITNWFLFLKTSLPPEASITAAEYFIDADPGFGMAIPISVTFTSNIPDKPLAVDVSSKSEGLHTLFIRSKDANNKWSVTNKFLFLKTTLPPPPLITGAEYFIDTDPGFGNARPIPLTGNPDVPSIPLNVDIATASQGLHTLFLRSKDANNKWSITNRFLFYKTSNVLYNITEAEYFIDSDPGFGAGTKIASITSSSIDSNVNFSIDLTALDTGFHDLFIRSKNAAGKWSITNYLQFQKTNSSTPVTWLSFDAIPLQNKVLLEWKTATEQNSSYFEIEFSANGSSFSSIGKVAAMGNTNSETSYEFTHTSPLYDQTNYYRIKQFDKDGKFTYSTVRTAKLNTTPAFTVMPNPVRNNLIIHTTTPGLTVHIFESGGKNVLTQRILNNTTILNFSSLAKGMYYLVAEKEGKLVYTKKILKQ